MIKEAKNIDFLTSGREPTAQDFARISEWIKKDKQNNCPQIEQPKESKIQSAKSK